MHDESFDSTGYLSNVDPVMRRLIEAVGPFTLKPRIRRSPFESLARAIAYQQLHDKAAESILKRFIALFPGRRFPRPDELLAVNVRSIRKAGFSRAKVSALRDHSRSRPSMGPSRPGAKSASSMIMPLLIG